MEPMRPEGGGQGGRYRFREATGRAEAREKRRAEIMELRVQGHSYRQIAKIAGCGLRTVVRDLHYNLKRLAAKQDQAGAMLRQLEAERLDIALKAIMPAVAQGDPTAIDRLVKISERRCRLLGLDAMATTNEAGGGGGIVINVTRQTAPEATVNAPGRDAEAGDVSEVTATTITPALPAAGEDTHHAEA